jgi:signal transduction histidine kinase
MKFPILIFSLFTAVILRGSPTPSLHWQEKAVSLSGYLSVLEDKKGDLNIEKILQDTIGQNWQAYPSDYLMFGYRNHYFWLRLTIDFDTIPNKTLYWWFDIAPPQDALFYQITGNKIEKQVQTGINFPFSQRDVLNRALIFSFQPIRKGKMVIYARLHNDVGSMFGNTYLHTVNDFAVIDSQTTRKWSFFFAFMFFAALLNLGLWAVFKESIYIYYAFYLVCSTLMMISVNGFGCEWLWQNSPLLANASKVLWTFGMAAFLTHFIYRLLYDILKDNKYLSYTIKIQTFLLTLSSCLATGFQKIPLSILPKMLFFGNFVIFLTILIIGWMLFKGISKRFLPAYYFLAAFFPIILMGTAYYARNAGIIKWAYLQSPFSIVPAFCIEIIFLFIALLIRFQSYSKMKQEKMQMEHETQNRIQHERERISRDLHDNMGAQLSHIVRSVEWFSKHSKVENDADKDLLDNVNATAKDAISTLRESIWTLNKETITITDFIERYKKWASPLLKSAPQTELIFNENVEKNAVIMPEQSLQLFRILQEALNNTLKYANATKIIFDVQSIDNQGFKFIFSDNGDGFDIQNALEKGNGLANMQQRAEGIGAELNIRAQLTKGTTISINLP